MFGDLLAYTATRTPAEKGGRRIDYSKTVDRGNVRDLSLQ
jgi:hypothetical protein